MIDADYVSDLEHEVQDLTTELHSCFHRIEELQAVLREIAKTNNRRDRFSFEIDAIIVNALGDKNEDA